MSAETTTLEKLFETEAYKRNKLIYPHPKDLCKPFVDRVQDMLGEIPIVEITTQVDKESGAGLENGEDIKSYGRGLITIRFGEEQIGLRATIGLTWAYDITKPFIKVFFGATASACTNLCIFGASNIVQRQFPSIRTRDELQKEREWLMACKNMVDHTLFMTEDLMKNHVDEFNEIVRLIGILKNTDIDNEDIYDFIGRLYLEEVIIGNFDYSTFNEANRLLFKVDHGHENKMLYAVNRAEDEDLNLWKLYGALTQRLTDGMVEINSVADKTLEISNMILKYVED